MTKKHFDMFAKLIAENTSLSARKCMADVVVEVAMADNPRFDKARFLKACNCGDGYAGKLKCDAYMAN